MTDLHKGRVVWVTGAASGIGRATVEEILDEGGSAVGFESFDVCEAPAVRSARSFERVCPGSPAYWRFGCGPKPVAALCQT